MKNAEIKITIEGPNHSGKSTIAGLIKEQLYMAGIVYMHAPTARPSDSIRKVPFAGTQTLVTIIEKTPFVPEVCLSLKLADTYKAADVEKRTASNNAAQAFASQLGWGMYGELRKEAEKIDAKLDGKASINPCAWKPVQDDVVDSLKCAVDAGVFGPKVDGKQSPDRWGVDAGGVYVFLSEGAPYAIHVRPADMNVIAQCHNEIVDRLTEERNKAVEFGEYMSQTLKTAMRTNKGWADAVTKNYTDLEKERDEARAYGERLAKRIKALEQMLADRKVTIQTLEKAVTTARQTLDDVID